MVQQKHRIPDKFAERRQHLSGPVRLQHRFGHGMVEGNETVCLFLPTAGKPLKHHLAYFAERVLHRDLDQREVEPFRFLQHGVGNARQVAPGLDGQPHTVQLRKFADQLALHRLVILENIARSQQKIPRRKPVVAIRVIDNIDVADLGAGIGTTSFQRHAGKLFLVQERTDRIHMFYLHPGFGAKNGCGRYQ